MVWLFLLALSACDPNPFELPPILLETRASWSPDGGTIAYYRCQVYGSDTAGIWLIDTNGTNNRFLCPGLSADWSPDGERLVVGTPDWNICLIDKDGSNFEYLVHDWSSVLPTWSPDGKWVAFARPFGGGSSIINVETLEEKPIPGGGYGWSPDSKQLVYMYLPGSCYLKIVNLDDMNVRNVLVLELDKYGAASLPPRWSPDGERILFEMDISIWKVDTAGRNLIRLARNAVEPNWSPDGKRIVYTPYEDSARLWVMNSNGWCKHPLLKK